MVEQEWLSVTEAANYTGVTRLVVRGWIRQGLASSMLPGRGNATYRIRISKTDLDAWVRGQSRREDYRGLVSGD